MIAGIFSAPVYAQENKRDESGPPPSAPKTVFDGTYATVGLGASISPSYDGSDNYAISVLPVIMGAIDGIEFTPRGPGFAVDFARDEKDDKIDLTLGIVGTMNFDRVNNIKDPVVQQLGKLDLAVEIGPVAGIQINRLLHGYDSLSFSLDAKWDVAGAHNGMLLVPSVTYFTPLSKGIAVSVAISAEHVDDDYADYYYSINGAGSAASGLPVYNANGGWNKAGVNIFAGFDMDGDITNGGFGIFALGGYSRMLGDAKRSPVTSIRGDADQLFGAFGVGYTF